MMGRGQPESSSTHPLEGNGAATDRWRRRRAFQQRGSRGQTIETRNAVNSYGPQGAVLRRRQSVRRADRRHADQRRVHLCHLVGVLQGVRRGGYPEIQGAEPALGGLSSATSTSNVPGVTMTPGARTLFSRDARAGLCFPGRLSTPLRKSSPMPCAGDPRPCRRKWQSNRLASEAGNAPASPAP